MAKASRPFDRENVAPRVRAALKMAGYTTAGAAAELMGYRSTAAAGALFRARVMPSVEAVFQIRAVTSISTDWLLGGEPSGLSELTTEQRKELLALVKQEEKAIAAGTPFERAKRS